jgi:hypothetical protein
MIWTLHCPFPLQRGADPADAAVHHVGGRNDVRPGRCLDQSLLDQDL